ncbi:Ig-like domain-containing protein [Reichenbachiella agarivorans]|uniref:Ig-like domain-containing protein n=1 Tax=Reichenbachiella agarivorans TaxID=2979464 RepID=A0ABY6CL94_9BACT|nr:Ig-like domain-containing protein [Reichenbachiella agarivorans]UXP31286.1 Ig-like domain-containing protein [Reichenbachiella agarivorans]
MKKFALNLLFIIPLTILTSCWDEDKVGSESNCSNLNDEVTIGDNSTSYILYVYAGGAVYDNYSYYGDSYYAAKSTFDRDVLVTATYSFEELIANEEGNYEPTEKKTDRVEFEIKKGDHGTQSKILFQATQDGDVIKDLVKSFAIESVVLTYSSCADATQEIKGEDVKKGISEEEEEGLKTVAVNIGTEITEQTATSFTVVGNSALGGDPEATEYGVAYIKKGSADRVHIASDDDADNFDVTITDLTTNSTYYVFAYAIQDGEYVYSTPREVTLVSNLVTDITLTGTETVEVGSTTQLSATVLPADATDMTVTWTAENDNATVTTDGLITGVSAGTCKITATANDGSGIIGELIVTVTEPVPTVTFNSAEYEISGASSMSYDFEGISYLIISLHRHNGDVQDFNINIELLSTEEIISGTYAFNGETLSFNNETTEVATCNGQHRYYATGGSIELSIENGDYTVTFNITTEGGALIGSYTTLAADHSEL